MPKYVCTLAFCVIAVVGLCPDILVPKVYGLAESTGLNGSNAQAVHDLGQIGQDVNVGLIAWDNARTTHEAFYDKDSNGNPIGTTHAFSYDFTNDGTRISNHDTYVAGIVASRGGFYYPNYIGVAPGVDIHSAKVIENDGGYIFSYLNNALQSLITNYQCRVIVTGIAFGSVPDGQSPETMLYDYYAYQYDVVFANPAGNEGSVIAVFGDAYNGITTGGLRVTDPDVYLRVGSVSGSGPTSDGRRKPDIVAPAQNQTVPTGGGDTIWTPVGGSGGETSYSTPHTAGVAALLLGLADSTPEPNDNHNEVIKAVIINSTFPNINDKLNNQTNPSDVNNTWNCDRGYGRIDALRAYELLDTNQVATDVNITGQKGWGFGTLAVDEEHTYKICVQQQCRLLVTLTWDRRIEWTDKRHGPGNPKNGLIDSDELLPYLADLDLIIYGPNDSNTIFSEQKNNLEPNDNLEKCDILLVTAGDYTVKIVNDSNNDETAD